MTFNILIVDDHPMTVDSYVNLLSEEGFNTVEPFFIQSYNCETAYKKIVLLEKQNVKIDFAIIDVNLPPYPDQNISNGIDLAALIRKTHPACKILLLTMHTEAFIVNRVINEIQPEGFISKSEVNFESFPNICKKILLSEIIYSDEIIKSQKKISQRNLDWGEYDIQILILLSQGVKMIDIPNHLPLSLSSIEKRKAYIKSHLLPEKGGDIELINKARQLGFL
ncbi:response regulator transcription factor [Flavobacterium pectinovorum]|uniref:DNA-binding response regulator n=1 Tax=Flavobacterium pectinovorum TaxID=29533 RepID=A0A502EUS8_9FLAO|nr:response regulator transcription factor [Flavobacterium pectinovorum]TPG40862.1 DNA-binding response regulator [Flavobacterium pectinovorum]